MSSTFYHLRLFFSVQMPVDQCPSIILHVYEYSLQCGAVLAPVEIAHRLCFFYSSVAVGQMEQGAVSAFHEAAEGRVDESLQRGTEAQKRCHLTLPTWIWSKQWNFLWHLCSDPCSKEEVKSTLWFTRYEKLTCSTYWSEHIFCYQVYISGVRIACVGVFVSGSSLVFIFT